MTATTDKPQRPKQLDIFLRNDCPKRISYKMVYETTTINGELKPMSPPIRTTVITGMQILVDDKVVVTIGPSDKMREISLCGAVE